MAKTQTWRQKRGRVYVQGLVYVAKATIGLVDSFLFRMGEIREDRSTSVVNAALRLKASAEDFKLALERWRKTWEK